ncbi:MAG: substrate-binding domain-containing protein [Erysipelotrichaceae bacterium]|nr:substrate-binding domain-containing protein [Erysipelotrichaceae bacterium]MBR3151364.1 substrate-binding domain-containing protein [Erysipelotrichaceae bacterium]
MKKLLALLLAVAMVFSMAACNSSSNTPTPSEAPAEGGSDTKVAVFWYAFSDAYLSTVRSALDADLEAAGIEYQDFDGNNNQGTQLEQVQTAVTNGFNVLVVNLVTSGSADAAQQIISAAGDVPVVFFNRAVEGDGEEGTVLGNNANVAFIGTDAPEAGHMQGKMIGDFLVANYDATDLNGDGAISYAMFMGDAANVEAIYRTQFGVEDANAVLTENGKPELVYFNAANTDKYQLDPNGAWSNAAANDFMNTNLAEYSEANGNMIELVIANNDDMALGAIAALQSAGYNLGDGKSVKIPVFGVDATQAAQDAIKADTMTGTVKQDADGMAQAICTAVSAIAEGATVADAAAKVVSSGDIFTMAEGFTNKVFVAYAPFTE